MLEVGRGTPADEAGIEASDVIVGIDGEDVDDLGDLLGALRRHDPGDAVQLSVVRGSEQTDVEVELGAAPSS